MYKEEKELWVKFACAALAGVLAGDWSGETEKIADTVCENADWMVARFYDKFRDC